MSMRLLPKSELLEAQAADQKQKIDEGRKIASRVDVLRETYSVEEKKLNDLRMRKVAQYNQETAKALEERDTARKEAVDARQERDESRKPLDKEWRELAKAQAAQEITTQELRVRTAVIVEREKASSKALKAATDTLVRAQTKEDRAKDLLFKANEDREETQRAREEAQTYEERAKSLAEQVAKDLFARDNSLALKERGVILREANQDEREAELAKGWKLLEDRKAAFEKRINKSKK